MSYDLMVFDNKKAPRNKEEFLEWWNKQSEWSEEHSYNNPAVTSENLRNLFMELIEIFPPLNGDLSPDDACWDDSDWCEKFEDKCTDYSIGKDVIYCAFARSESEEAYNTLKTLAKKHKVGFFNTSGDGAIEYNY